MRTMTISIPYPKAIIFDWDGVLVDTKDVIAQAYFYTFLSMGKTAPEIEALHQLPGTSLRDYFPKIFGKDTSKAERFFYSYILENHLKLLKTTEGAEKLLIYIHEKNIPMAVLSNKRGDILREEVSFLKWDKFFHKVIGSKDCIEDKPSPKVVTMTLEGLSITVDRSVWLVGDWLADLECAHKSGLFSILIHNQTLKRQKNVPYPFDIYMENCKELKKFLSWV